MRTTLRTAIALLAVALAAPACAAGDSSFLFPTLSGTVGSYFIQTDSRVRVDGNTTVLGTPIDLEKELGLGDSGNLFRFGLGWRPFARHEFTLGYFSYSRDASRTIGRDIEFGGVVYPSRASVEAEAKLEFVEGAYTYWAARNERFGWGLSIGGAMIRAKASLSARLGQAQTETKREASTDLPVPAVGTEVRYAFRPNLVGAVRLAGLPKVTIGDYTGSVVSYGVRLEWEVIPHVGIGASWSGYRIDFEVEKRAWSGELLYDLQGAQAYLRFRI